MKIYLVKKKVFWVLVIFYYFVWFYQHSFSRDTPTIETNSWTQKKVEGRRPHWKPESRSLHTLINGHKLNEWMNEFGETVLQLFNAITA